MTTNHPLSRQLGDYLANRVDHPTASSIEAHLMSCTACRSELASSSPSSGRAESWASLERAIDAEPVGAVQRFASRIGLPEHEIRTLAPTVSLRFGWLVAMFVSLLTAAAIAKGSGGPADGLPRMMFLTITPLAPLAAVVAALGATSEPAPEIAGVTPSSRLRIGAVRAATVMLASVAMGVVASSILPGSLIDSVRWLLPALALSAIGALLAGRFATTNLIYALGSGWVVAVLASARLAGDRLVAFRPDAQLLYLVAIVIAAVVLTFRPDSFDLRRNQ